MGSLVETTGQSSALCSLPVEVLREVSDQLAGVDHSALSRTCRYLHFALHNQLLFRFAMEEHCYPFSYAIRHDNIALAARVLAYRKPSSLGDVDVYCGTSPLGFAAQSRKIDMVSFLLQHGFDANARGEDGRRPLTHAIVGLDTHEFGMYTLSAPALPGILATTTKLLEHGADPNYDISEEMVDEGVGMLPLHPIGYFTSLFTTGWVDCKDAVCILDMLLKAGASPNSVSGWDGAPLIYSLIRMWETHSLPVLKLLLRHGANANQRCTLGVTPVEHLLETSEKLYTEPLGRTLADHVLNMLSSHGADMNEVTSKGRTPLTLAVENCTEWSTGRFRPAGLPAVAKLLELGADPNLHGNQDGTETSRGGHTLLVKTLLSTLGNLGFAPAKEDYNRISTLFEQTIAGLRTGDSSDDETRATLTTIPTDGWNNPIVPVLLNAGAGLSRADLDIAQSELLRLGAWHEDIHGLDLGLARLFLSAQRDIG